MGTVTKVVIDTNVFISAFGWDGKPEAIEANFKGSSAIRALIKDYCITVVMI